jgi:hypothetical protein
LEQPERSSSSPGAEFSAAECYLLLADISGYTGFITGVSEVHGVDFSGGIPAAYGVLNSLLDTVIAGIAPDFSVVKLEGDAVFAAGTASLDGQGGQVLGQLAAMYQAFVAARTRAIPASDHECTACPAVAHLDLKVVLHRGHVVRQSFGTGSDLLGPAVTVAHRLLKNTVRERIGAGPYLLLTDAAATALGVPEVGIAHGEEYADAGRIQGRIVELGSSRSGAASEAPAP